MSCASLYDDWPLEPDSPTPRHLRRPHHQEKGCFSLNSFHGFLLFFKHLVKQGRAGQGRTGQGRSRAEKISGQGRVAEGQGRGLV